MKLIEKYETLFDQLFPICRSILGPGYRQSLEIIRQYIPFEIIEVKTGTRVFDWTVPQEWIVEEAYLEKLGGGRIIDYKENNLHVVNYSAPYEGVLTLEELKPHLYTDEALPNAIPYITSYYQKNWGLCMAHKDCTKLEKGRYRVVIRTRFINGSLQIGEIVLPGRSKKEILITSYLCHPSMANNELSGPLVQIYLYEKLKQLDSRTFTYRFLINPETIGAIAFLSKRYKQIKKNVIGGLVLTCLGGPKETLSYKRSKQGHSIVDRAFMSADAVGEIRNFQPLGGSDERQYNSIGINLPVGQIARTVYEQYPEYHTSLDNKDFMDIRQVLKSARNSYDILLRMESKTYFINVCNKCEPQLGKRNLYPNVNSAITRAYGSSDTIGNGREFKKAVMFLLGYSSGTKSLEEIASLAGMPPKYLFDVATLLETHKLLKRI